jgi:hypothetical protein
VTPRPEAGAPIGDPDIFRSLVSPFDDELSELGVTVDSFQAYRYEGGDKDAFFVAVNSFYRTNPGFCPLQEAFYAAENGLQFMTLAGDNGLQVRGFLYDHSRKPRLTYAYFEGTSEFILPATACETAGEVEDR